MTYRTDDSHAVDDDYEVDEEEPRRGLLSWILIVALLAGTGSGSAMLWRTFGGGPILASLTSPTTAIATARPSGGGDIDALRQEITGSVQSTQQLLAAQQAEIKRLTEQVSALSGKLELLQRPVTSAQAAILVPAPKAVVPAPKKKPEIAKPVAAKPVDAKPVDAKPSDAKPADVKPVEAKPTNGPISTGGAPLQLQFSR